MNALSVFISVGGLGFFCVAILLYQRYQSLAVQVEGSSMEKNGISPGSQNSTVIEDVDAFRKLMEIVELTRKSIREDMTGYPYPNGKYNISATKLEDLVIDDNGRPIRSVVVSNWRSGSNFFGAILAAHPGNFYFVEPLLHFNFIQIRGPPLASEALQQLKAQLSCDFSGLDDHAGVARLKPWQLYKNKYVWDGCKDHNSTCYDHRYLSEVCKLCPYQSIKTTRLRLRVAQELLADEELGVRMMLLVRDPRGTMQSRKHHWWCPPSPDCSDPALHCADLVSDYKIARELLKKYPSTFRVIRYEDLSADPFRQVEEFYEFYGRYFHPNVREYLETHTSAQFDSKYGTSRDSKSTPFHWKTDSTFEEVEEIQQSCAVAMKHWGYVQAMNATHLREFNPVTNYNMLDL